MGASRKLQGEIDRVLKKVQEGVEIFDSIWNKVYDTDNANQKEKFEADLKKEIKKLQRYRDQIKAWLQSNEIKDKKALMDARKLIEKEMERFKICEKETKTKAFSKEGLEQQPKADPKEKAKSETRDWLNNTVSELESQIDSFEAEMEGLSVKKGKARPPRLIHLESSINRHKAHIMKLELILRLLDNDELSPEEVNDVKDLIDDYVERNQDDFESFDDVDMLYNSLPLDKVESLEELVTIVPAGIAKTVGTTTAVSTIKSTLSTSAQSPTTVTSSTQDPVQEQIDDVAPQENISEILPKIPSPKLIPIPPTPAAPTVPVGTTTVLSGQSSVKGNLDNSPLPIPSSPMNNSTKEEEFSITTRKPSPVLRSNVTNLPPLIIPVTSGITVSGVGSMTTPSSESARSGITQPLVSPLNSRMLLPQVSKTSDAVPGTQWRPGNPFRSQLEGAPQFRGRTEIEPDQREKFLQRFQQVQQQQQQQSQSQSQTTLFTKPFTPLHYTSQTPTATSALQQIDNSAPETSLDKETDPITLVPVSVSLPGPARDADVSLGQPVPSTPSPVLGVIGRRSVSDLGAIGTQMSFGVPNDQLSTLELLDSAFCKLPLPEDSERVRNYIPRKRTVTPSHYPQNQADIVNNPAFWERLGSDNIGTDTLFFAFYNQQKTYQQYLAAKELKKQSWRYHKKYNTWFQRHEEPKLATDDFEQGTYVYFDFHMGIDDIQNGWCQRIKTEFKFEYNFLEDELVV